MIIWIFIKIIFKTAIKPVIRYTITIRICVFEGRDFTMVIEESKNKYQMWVLKISDVRYVYNGIKSSFLEKN